MAVGVVFPQTEIGIDPDVIREFARTAEDRGFDHLLAYDHVLGVDPDAHPDWEGAYDYRDTFHEPLTLFSHLAAVTDDLEFVTGVLVLPQRQTPLVAKQATQVDVLSGGRIRLGVANGWNDLEFAGMGREFDTRARRIEEQIEVLRRLWTEEAVEFDGEFHTLPSAGIDPRPVQRPIPVWLGGMADPVLRRVARTADGWLPEGESAGRAEPALDRLREFAREADRDPETIGIHGRLRVEPGDAEGWVEGAREWADLGADYVAVNPMYSGLAGEDHVAFLDDLADALDDAGLL